MFLKKNIGMLVYFNVNKPYSNNKQFINESLENSLFYLKFMLRVLGRTDT